MKADFTVAEGKFLLEEWNDVALAIEQKDVAAREQPGIPGRGPADERCRGGRQSRGVAHTAARRLKSIVGRKGMTLLLAIA